MADHIHCDDYIDDPTTPEPLRVYLARARAPAHGMLSQDPYPKLFADYEGERVRVVMASRHGHVGITSVLGADFGYDRSVYVDRLSNFASEP